MMKKLLFLFGITTLFLVGCTKDENQKDKQEEEEPTKEEETVTLLDIDGTYELNQFHITSMEGTLGMKQDSFELALTEDNVTFESLSDEANWEYYTVYDLVSDNSPFKQYDVSGAYQNYYDYSKARYGVALSVIKIKCNEFNDKMTLQETFDFISERFVHLRKENIEYIAYNDDLEYYEYTEDTKGLVDAIENPDKDVNVKIVWANESTSKTAYCIDNGCPADLKFDYDVATKTATISMSAFYSSDIWKYLSKWDKY